MKNTVKALSLLLLVLLMLASCAKPADNGPDTTAALPAEPSGSDSGEVTTEEPVRVDENGYILDSLPAELKLNDKTYNVLYWSDAEHTEFTADAITGDLVNDAIINRNITVESRLGCKLNFIGEKGNGNNIQSFVKKVQSSITSGGKEYQIIGTYSRTAASLAVNGLLQDISQLEYFDFDAPWWPDSLIDEATMNNKLYFASGDISTNMLHMMYTVFFNKTILAEHSLEDPYALVSSGGWTLDKMLEMSSGVYEDLNGNGVKEDTDKFGFMTSRLHIDPFYFTAGLRTTERGGDGMIEVSDDLFGEAHMSVVEKLCNTLYNTNDGFYTVKASGVPAQNAFASNRALFICDRARTAFYVDGMDQISFGVVPTPKYDAAQENYVTTLGFPYSLYCLPKDNDSPSEASAILECLASESYRQITPQLFEVTMKVKYVNDEDASRMYDIIRAAASFDLGRIYYDSLNNITVTIFRDNIGNKGEGFGSGRATIIPQLEKYLEKIVDTYK